MNDKKVRDMTESELTVYANNVRAEHRNSESHMRRLDKLRRFVSHGRWNNVMYTPKSYSNRSGRYWKFRSFAMLILVYLAVAIGDVYLLDYEERK